MEVINQIESTTVVLANSDIDTDQIIPARFLTTTQRAGLGDSLFAEWRYDETGNLRDDFVLNTDAAKGCEILVAGDNFGCGSSREHAPWALLDYGFKAVISTSMADIFRSNALKNGLLPIVVDKNTHARLIENPGIKLTADLVGCEIRFTDGTEVSFNIDAFSRHCLMNGIDELGFLLQQKPNIENYEGTHS